MRCNIKYDESIFPCDNFGIAFESPGLDSKIPVGATIKLVSADIECDIGLESNKIKVKIIPQDQDIDETQKLFIEIYTWVNQYKPLFLLNWWGRLMDAGKWFYIFLYSFMALGLIILNLLQPNKPLEIQKLLEGGIVESEIPKAIEFLLVNAQTSPQLYFPPWFGVLSTMVVVISLILAFRPKIILGIGKKASNRLTFWKYYYIVLGFVIVTTVTVGIEKLVSLFSS